MMNDVHRHSAQEAAPPEEVDGMVLVVEAGRTGELYWRDLWHYRELFYFLAWRDLLVRYKQTVIGVSWAVLRPFIQMIVFTVIFGAVAGLPSEGAPYALMVLAGILPWNFFANGLSESSMSLVNNRNLVSKIYFPRLIVPASSMVVGLVDFLVAAAIFAGMMLWYQFMPSWHVLFFPFFLLVAGMASFGAGLWVSALYVKYRDIRHIIPFVVQVGAIVSGVGFRSEAIPEKWRFVYSLNPMVGVVDGFRWSLLGADTPLYIPGVACSLVLVTVLLASGFWYFRRVERTFADII